jgi:hypothetical protein
MSLVYQSSLAGEVLNKSRNGGKDSHEYTECPEEHDHDEDRQYVIVVVHVNSISEFLLGIV